MKKLIIIKLHKEANGVLVSVRVKILDNYDNELCESTVPIEMFKNKTGIEVGKRIFLTCDY
jgi:hypothetical protein